MEECKTRAAELSKGLAHPARVEIVRMLSSMPDNERCICGDIVNALPLAQSSVSQHLKILKETGWIQGEIDGPRVCYCIVAGILEYYISMMNQFISTGPAKILP
jgi:DNA-binding transcriptional ArsR family regulator